MTTTPVAAGVEQRDRRRTGARRCPRRRRSGRSTCSRRRRRRAGRRARARRRPRRPPGAGRRSGPAARRRSRRGPPCRPPSSTCCAARARRSRTPASSPRHAATATPPTAQPQIGDPACRSQARASTLDASEKMTGYSAELLSSFSSPGTGVDVDLQRRLRRELHVARVREGRPSSLARVDQVDRLRLHDRAPVFWIVSVTGTCTSWSRRSSSTTTSKARSVVAMTVLSVSSARALAARAAP